MFARGQKVGEFWSKDAERRALGADVPIIDWTMSPTVQRIINRRVSGSEDVDWLEWLRRSYCPDGLGLVLSVGCGIGLLERELLGRGMCERIVGIDIAEGALATAREASCDMAVTYEKVDLEREPLTGGPYDAVFAVATLHHINCLGQVAEKLRDALADGGYLFVLEYVGPSRFQWSPEQLRLVGDIHSMLPWRYRMHFQAGGTVAYSERTPPCSMIRSDPSEAVRSSDIEGVLADYFELIDARPIGGTILNPLLGGIVGSFDESSELDRSFISTVGALEDELIAEGLLPSDFKVLVYRRRSALTFSPETAEAEAHRAEHVAAQERQIADLHQRFLELDEACEELRRAIRSADVAAVDLGRDVEEAVAFNASLKHGVLFGLMRLIKGTERVAPSALKSLDAGADLQGESCGLAAFGSGDYMATALGRASGRYAGEMRSGSAVLWMSWLREMLPLPLGKAVVVGLEPWEVDLVSSLGPVDRGLEGYDGLLCVPSDELYDLVIAGPAVSGVAVSAAANILAEGGRLVLIGGEGQIATDGTAEPFALEGRVSLTASCHAAAADVLLEAGEEAEDRAMALAGLIVYSESVLAGHGLMQEAVGVSVYRKGSGTPVDIPRATADIVAVQDAEIDRLTRAVAHRTDVSVALREALDTSEGRIERARADQRQLAAERAVLERRGALMYWRRAEACQGAQSPRARSDDRAVTMTQISTRDKREADPR